MGIEKYAQNLDVFGSTCYAREKTALLRESRQAAGCYEARIHTASKSFSHCKVDEKIFRKLLTGATKYAMIAGHGYWLAVGMQMQWRRLPFGYHLRSV
jgi:hypothetical protein